MSSEEEDPYESIELRELSKILDLKYPQSFVDLNGSLAVLPVDSHTSLARYITSYNIRKLKRYCVNHVYRSDSSGSPLEASTELAFDIVSSEREAAYDAQVIQLIANTLRDCKVKFVEIQMSHHLLVEALLVYCKVPADKRSKFCQRLKMKNGMIQSLVKEDFVTDAQLKLFLKLINIRGSFDGLITYFGRLPDWVESGAAALADEGFKELKEIINVYEEKNRKLRDVWRYPVRIKVNVGFENYETHSGFLFRFTYNHQIDIIE